MWTILCEDRKTLQTPTWSRDCRYEQDKDGGEKEFDKETLKDWSLILLQARHWRWTTHHEDGYNIYITSFRMSVVIVQAVGRVVIFEGSVEVQK